ncbi:MAG: hypothetical protein H7Y15_05890, partial [Pseudonocardia sp.]|nr:hypothetical protein [Pseudonocardia sp.]
SLVPVPAITDAGHAAFAAALPGVRAFNSPESLGITPDQLQVLDELLHTVLRSVDAAPGPARDGR